MLNRNKEYCLFLFFIFMLSLLLLKGKWYMKNLTIKNIGAIKEVSIELNKINVIMGPQSSGKSTICKIASYCKWVEKKICLSQSPDSYQSQTFLEERLVKFHKLEGYFSENSYIRYETDTLIVVYDAKNGNQVELKDPCGYQRSKVAYIPAERNIVSVINNWFEVRFKETNIRSFMIDWDDSRKNYSKSNPLSIINFDMKYYFDDTTGKDLVFIDNGKLLELTNTSSGLQSLIPLLVLTDYLISHLNRIDEKSSVADEVLKKKVIQSIYEEYFEIKNFDFPQEEGDVLLFVDEQRLFKSSEDKERFDTVIDHMFKTQSVNLYIEEPELNLFPSAQKVLLYELIKQISVRESDRLIITTHSHYILYALNNCIMGYLVKDKMPEEVKKEIECRGSWIDPTLVSVWEIKDGYLKGLNNMQNATIQQEDGLIGNNYFDSNMREIMDDFYKMLNYYGDDSDED